MARPFERVDFWHQHVVQWRDSGLSLAAYSARHNLSRTTLWRWSSRLKTLPGPITLVPAIPRPSTGPLVLRRGPWQLELPDTTPADWLADLLGRLS